jgi:hypothetical protein
MFGALLADPQEMLYKQHLVYYMRVMSVGCTTIEAEASIVVQPTCVLVDTVSNRVRVKGKSELFSTG